MRNASAVHYIKGVRCILIHCIMYRYTAYNKIGVYTRVSQKKDELFLILTFLKGKVILSTS